MKKQFIYRCFTILISLSLLLGSCTKESEWLNEKSNKSAVVPETLKDYQALLDDPYVANRYYTYGGNAGTDNFYVADEDIANLSEEGRSKYRWDKNIVYYNNVTSSDWNLPFTLIEYANLTIDGLEKINKTQSGYNNLLGQAFFYRSKAYFSLAQVFCKPYDLNTSKTDPGLPIRLISDVNQIITDRSTVEKLYEQILADALQALALLDEQPKNIQRPSKTAANALLSKIYLMMYNYTKAEDYANEVLKIKNELINFNNSNQVSHSFAYKFPDLGIGNPEIIFYTFSGGEVFSSTYLDNVVQASKSLYDLYESNDLRKEYFFGSNGKKLNFVSNYTGTYQTFGGLSTNEVLLIRAECYARNGKEALARTDINNLLKNRYITDTFTDITLTDPEALLRKILDERRKELPQNMNSRWEDLRRLNKDPRFQTTLNRTVQGLTYTLPPNDPKYVLPIPQSEIIHSGLEQNQR